MEFIFSHVLKSEPSGGQEAEERGSRMSEGVEVTAIDKRDEKRASEAWKNRAMHIAALDSSTEAGGRGGKSIESLSKNEREKRRAREEASAKGERDRKGEKEGRRENGQGTEEERYLSLSLSLSSRVAETMRSIVECPLVDMRIPYLFSCTARP